ncbi:hypothetical protein [Pseudomonas sp. LRF_L74]|uniref:hypothetical protein n=1 Tax=Pseudomonas sp. LRF_L74 TaxID=3369422 RepID=UPI003F610D80
MDEGLAHTLAATRQLELQEWLNITDVGPGAHNAYLITTDGVFFHPNENAEKHGWSEEQIQEASSEYALGHKSRTFSKSTSRAQVASRMLIESQHQLLFPCTPKALIDFIDGDVTGDLFGCLPDTFRKAVDELPDEEPPDIDSDAALGASRRLQVKEFSARPRESSDVSKEKWERWKKCANEIQSENPNRIISKRSLAPLVKKRLNLNDSEETIRRRI